MCQAFFILQIVCFVLYARISKKFDLFTFYNFFTDDSVMTLAIGKALLDVGKDYSNLSKRAVYNMQKIGRRYPDCGYGSNFYHWVFSDNPKPYNSYGNGSAMRISAVGHVANSIEEAIRNAISVGGDSDTLAAITGSIAAAYYGVPVDLREQAMIFLDESLLEILIEFEKIYPPLIEK